MAAVTDQYNVIPAITAVANADGIDPNLAIAIARQESGLDPYRVGDQGTSFGLYQLHQGGELPASMANSPRVAGHGGSIPQAATDPTANAQVSLAEVASVAHAHPTWSPGQIAAAAQRPANETAYANSINSMLGQNANYSALASSGQTVQSGNAATGQPASLAGDLWNDEINGLSILGLGGPAKALGSLGSDASQFGSNLNAIQKFLEWFSASIPELAIRFVELIAGGACLIAGMIMIGKILSGSSGAGGSVGDAAGVAKKLVFGKPYLAALA